MTHKFRFLSELILGGGLVCYSVLAIIGFILFPNNEPKLQTSLQAAYVLIAAALILGVALIYSGVRHARSGMRTSMDGQEIGDNRETIE